MTTLMRIPVTCATVQRGLLSRSHQGHQVRGHNLTCYGYSRSLSWRTSTGRQRLTLYSHILAAPNVRLTTYSLPFSTTVSAGPGLQGSGTNRAVYYSPSILHPVTMFYLLSISSKSRTGTATDSKMLLYAAETSPRSESARTKPKIPL